MLFIIGLLFFFDNPMAFANDISCLTKITA